MENASIGVIGVTGFVGRYLARSLAQKGYRVVGFSRAGKGTCVGVTEWRSSHVLDFSGLHGVVNLAGERIDQRWTEANRVKFAESRVGITQRIVKQLSAMELGQRPKVWINASAVGFYANRGDELLPESSTAGAGYLADLCVDWEKSTTAADQLGVRCVMVRIGMVLGRGGMAWDRLKRVFSLGGGARLGSGRQWMPWIHVEDLVAGIIFSVETQTLSGSINGVAPHPERNVDFTKKLASALRRPAIFVAPGFMLRLVFGEFGDFLLGGQRCVPQRWVDAGMVFLYPRLEDALGELIG
jgi:uncharacterized protein (TIGR01777 family)